MWPSRFWPAKYWPARFWPKAGASFPIAAEDAYVLTRDKAVDYGAKWAPAPGRWLSLWHGAEQPGTAYNVTAAWADVPHAAAERVLRFYPYYWPPGNHRLVVMANDATAAGDVYIELYDYSAAAQVCQIGPIPFGWGTSPQETTTFTDTIGSDGNPHQFRLRWKRAVGAGNAVLGSWDWELWTP